LLISTEEDGSFSCILSDKHVQYQLLPPERHSGYILRPLRKGELCLINKSRLDEKNFV